jgi:nitroreductase
MHCQHCLAICPSAAISIDGFVPEASRPLSKSALPSLDQMDLLVRGRRSIRQYRDENVDSALIQRLLDAVAHAPTGVNRRELAFTIIRDKSVMAVLRSRVMGALEKALNSGSFPKEAAYLARMVSLWRDEGRDFIFRGAPHLLIVSAPPETPTPQQDVPLTLAYFELLAQSAGLGTVWCGLLKRAFEALPELKSLVDLPPDHVYYAMLFGRPAVRYARTVQHEGTAQVREIHF